MDVRPARSTYVRVQPPICNGFLGSTHRKSRLASTGSSADFPHCTYYQSRGGVCRWLACRPLGLRSTSKNSYSGASRSWNFDLSMPSRSLCFLRHDQGFCTSDTGAEYNTCECDPPPVPQFPKGRLNVYISDSHVESTLIQITAVPFADPCYVRPPSANALLQ